MKKNIIKSLLAIACLLCSIGVYAHEFEVDGIYYISYGSHANVTYKSYSYDAYDNEYTGAVVIPARVTYGGTTYSVTSIGERAFSYCTGLTEVTIPNSVVSIGEHAFSGCTGLTEVTIPNSVTSIGSDAFAYCTGLTEVTIPNGVTSIGDDAFWDCTGLTEITIPNSVTSIGEYAFYRCTGLTEVTIGNSVTMIGEWAFAYCEGLTEMRIEAVNPPAIYDNTFEGVDKSIPLYVPAESVEAYRTADYWEYFINISEDLSYSAVEDITCDNSDAPTEYYDLNGFRIENPTHGIYIVKHGDIVRKVFVNKVR